MLYAIIREQDASFDPEVISAMVAAYHAALRELGLSASDDAATRAVAKRVIEFAARGEREFRTIEDRDARSFENVASRHFAFGFAVRRRTIDPAFVQLHQNHQQLVWGLPGHLVELSKGLAEHRADRAVALTTIETGPSRWSGVFRHDTSPVHDTSNRSTRKTAKSFRANGNRSRSASQSAALLFIPIWHRDARAFGEFCQSQPHRRHFSERPFVLRRARQLRQPQTISSVLPVHCTGGHLDPSLRSDERSEASSVPDRPHISSA